MKILFFLTVFVSVSFSIVSFAQDFVLEPGDEVVVYSSPSIVSCRDARPFSHYCKCVERGFDKVGDLEMILDKTGNDDVLATYPSLAKCEEGLRTNPGCSRAR